MRYYTCNRTLFVDFIWDNLLKVLGSKKMKVVDLPKFPYVKRDLALLLNSETEFKEWEKNL